MEVGNLTVPVSADLGPITQQLEQLKRQLGQTETQTQGVTNAMQGVQRQTSGLTAALRPLAAALAGLFSVSALIKFTNTWTDLSSRVNLAAGSIEKGSAVMDQLQVIARRTYSSLEITTEAYIRNAQTLRDLGKSTQETLDYTEALNNALVVSGARAERAERVQNALGKALAAGVLRGDELNTVIESGGRVAELLAEELGTTVAGLRGVGQQGKITGDVINDSLVGNLEKLREEAESMPATIGDAFQLIANALLQTIGVFDSANEVSGTLAGWLITIADNMQRAVTYTGAAVTVWGAYHAAILLVNAGLFTTAGALTAVRVAFTRLALATVIGAVVVVIGELLNMLYSASQATETWGETFALLGKRVSLVLDGIKFGFYAATEGLQSVWSGAMADILRETEAAFGGILRVFGISAESIAGQIDRLSQRAVAFGELAKTSAGIAADQFKAAFADFKMPGGGGPDLSGDGGPSRVQPTIDPKAARDAERLREAYQDLLRDSRAFIELQGIEQQAIGMTELEAAKLRATFDLLNQAQRAGINLTPQQTAELTKLAEAMATAEYETHKLQERYDFAKDTFKGFFTDMKSELQNGASIWEAFGTAATNALQKIADKALDMALNGIFDMIFGAIMGGIGGGFRLPNRAPIPTPRPFANGTSYAPGGLSLVGERGPELLNLPGGSQITPNNRVIAPAMANFGNGAQGLTRGDINVTVIGPNGDRQIREMVSEGVQQGLAEYDSDILPSSVERVRNHPRMR